MSSAALQIAPKIEPEASERRGPVRFRGRSFMALVLSPESPLDAWLAELDAMAARSPGFFSGRATVLDVSALKLSPRGLAALLGEMDKRGVRLIGIEGCDPKFLDGPNARLGAPIGGGRAAGDVALPDTGLSDTATPETAAPAAPTSLLIEQPVRSGQSIIFLNGDVTVCGSVASGAEIIASGSIHVYGALRGRAIAGCSGNAHARIFCRKLDAELLAIDGLYMPTDALDRSLRGKAAQIWLEGDSMRVTALD